ncbi:hypothetical protein MLD38_023198 [Melastoma candidum]|uniref:Uncharacterized protein n=1 Tax=Melastoma candidum TaxID=119954 RepID=A0ACB9QPT3_9MYRT|nr:hypothetical protein MLD38_023198 [Melastoma candidum]
MDLNMDCTLFCCDLTEAGNKFSSVGFGGKNASKAIHESTYAGDIFPKSSDDGCQLVLGLGPTPSAYSKSHPGIVKETLASETDSILKLGLSEVTKDGLSVLEGSVTGENYFNSYLPGLVSPESCRLSIPIVDEGSTSAKNSGGYLPSLLLDPRMDDGNYIQRLDIGTTTHCPLSQPSCEISATTEVSGGTISGQTATATSSNHRTGNLKKCKFPCCPKGARGASGLCIGHGGGQRCQKPGCNKGAESRTAYCKAHGGGRRCQELGCTKSGGWQNGILHSTRGRKEMWISRWLH